MSDAGADWISRFLTEGVRGGKRCVVIGGTEEFFSFLLFNDYAVAHLDQDQNELDQIRRVIVNEYEPPMNEFEQCCIDAESNNGFAWRADDILVLIRSLHHLRNPGEFLGRMRAALSKGTIFIVDWTIELFEKQLLGKEEERQSLHFSEEEKSKWPEYDRIDAECLGMVQHLRWRTGDEIMHLMRGAGLADMDLHYALPCPCGDYSCNKITTYWFGIWPAEDQLEKVLSSQALQKMIRR